MPDDITLETVAKDAKLLAAALNFAKREFNSENILFYVTQGDAKTLYEKFVTPEASKHELQVNLPAGIADPMHELAKAGKWQDPAWKQHLNDAKASIARLWNGDCRKRFLESKEYLATPAGQKAAAEAAAKKPTATGVQATPKAAPAAVKVQAEPPTTGFKKADPKRAAKRLGIAEENLPLLIKANDLAFKGDKNGALKLLTELVKKEQLKLKAEIILKQLQEAGF